MSVELKKESLEEYLIFLKIERGLSKNSIESYQRDLKQYITYLDQENIKGWDQVDRYIILNFWKIRKTDLNLIILLFE